MAPEKVVVLTVTWLVIFLFLIGNQKQKPMITEGGMGFIFVIPYVAAALVIAVAPLLVDWFLELTRGWFVVLAGVWMWILIFFNKKISLVVEKFFEKIV